MTRIREGNLTGTERPTFTHSRRAIMAFRNGMARQAEFKHGRAINDFERSQALDRSLVLAAYKKSWSFIAMGRYAEAAEAMKDTIDQHDGLQENYVRIGKSVEDCPRRELLFAVYENLCVLNAILNQIAQKGLGVKLLTDHINDPAFPPTAKTMLRLCKKGIEEMEAGQGRRSDPLEVLSFLLQVLCINLTRHIERKFAIIKDYRAMELMHLAQIKMIDHFMSADDKLADFKKNLQIELATVYFKLRATGICRRLLDEVLKAEPNHAEARMLLDELARIN